MVEHPSYWPGRDYRDRPNIHSCQQGAGGGRSLLLTGHIDTVALGDNVWTHPPFAAEIDDGRLYGLGTIDMKGPMGAMAVLYKALEEQGIRLKGDLELRDASWTRRRGASTRRSPAGCSTAAWTAR